MDHVGRERALGGSLDIQSSITEEATCAEKETEAEAESWDDDANVKRQHAAAVIGRETFDNLLLYSVFV